MTVLTCTQVELFFLLKWGLKRIALRINYSYSCPFQPSQSWHIKSKSTKSSQSPQHSRMGRGVIFMASLIAWSGFNPHPGHVFVSLDKMLYDNYLCLVALNKQQFQWTRIWKNSQQHYIGLLEIPKAGVNSSNYKIVNAMKCARIAKYLASYPRTQQRNQGGGWTQIRVIVKKTP